MEGEEQKVETPPAAETADQMDAPAEGEEAMGMEGEEGEAQSPDAQPMEGEMEEEEMEPQEDFSQDPSKYQDSNLLHAYG